MFKNKFSLLISFLIFAMNLFFQDWKILLPISFFLIVWNVKANPKLKQQLKRVWILCFFYLSTFLIQLYYQQEGKIVAEIGGFYITQEALIRFFGNFLRVINLILLSWMVGSQKLFYGRFAQYQEMVEEVIEFVPQVFILFKKRMKIKWFFKYVLKEVQSIHKED